MICVGYQYPKNRPVKNDYVCKNVKRWNWINYCNAYDWDLNCVFCDPCFYLNSEGICIHTDTQIDNCLIYSDANTC